MATIFVTCVSLRCFKCNICNFRHCEQLFVMKYPSVVTRQHGRYRFEFFSILIRNDSFLKRLTIANGADISYSERETLEKVVSQLFSNFQGISSTRWTICIFFYEYDIDYQDYSLRAQRTLRAFLHHENEFSRNEGYAR